MRDRERAGETGKPRKREGGKEREGSGGTERKVELEREKRERE